MDEYQRAQQAAETIARRVNVVPRVAIVLGSGLGEIAGGLGGAASMAYGELPHWPAATTAGHEGRLTIGTLGGRPVAALAGRCHAYEGYDLKAVTFAIRVMGRLGVTSVVLTNAAGGINLALSPGALMVIDDHLNLLGANPLTGPNDDRFGPRFPDLSQVYSPRLRAMAHQVADACRLTLQHGVYAAVAGPSYETPAEIRYLRTVGADAVGMSTVPEAIVARHMGLDVLGVSCITNMAAGVLPGPLDHRDVIATARRTRSDMATLLEGVVAQL